MRGNETVNQSISSSFDPAKLMCISCSSEHPVFYKKPVVIILSDQNFVPSLSGKCGDCIHIVRLENASLLELFELATEIFGDVTFQEGSNFMFGSGSHLGRSGSAMYARDWTDVVARSSAAWRGIRISPLIPLIVTECPGPIVRDASEFGIWLESVYDSNPLGMCDLWMELVAAMEENSMGTTTLETMDSYKCVFPSTLHCKTLDKVVTLCSNNSRPVTFKGLPKDRCSELLGNMLKYLHENFRACSRPKSFLVRADESKNESENKNEKITLLVGASNLKHSLPHFEEDGLRCTFIGKPGWISSAANVTELIAEVRRNAPVADAFVFDLLGNSSIRFEQFDGTSSLPFFSNGKHHLGGKVLTTPPEVFKKVVENVIPVIREKGNKPCVILPPLSQYLFASCCSDTDMTRKM